MKVIKCDLPAFNEIDILPMADLHLGDPRSDFKRVMEWIEYIKTHENVYTILNGDLMDSATRHSIGDVYSANLNPMEQLSQCVKIFEPIKDKILAVLPGNHESRIYRTDGIETTSLMCRQLGLDCYAPEGALLFIRFGRSNSHSHHRPLRYTIYATHGSGGGRTEGGKIKRLADLAAIVDADIYLHSHTHLPAIFKGTFYRADISNSVVVKVPKLFVNTGSTLEYGGYAEGMNLKPGSTDTPLIKMDGTKKRMTAVL